MGTVVLIKVYDVRTPSSDGYFMGIRVGVSKIKSLDLIWTLPDS